MYENVYQLKTLNIVHLCEFTELKCDRGSFFKKTITLLKIMIKMIKIMMMITKMIMTMIIVIIIILMMMMMIKQYWTKFVKT